MVEEKEIRSGNWFHHNDQWSNENELCQPHDFQFASTHWYWMHEGTFYLENIEPITLTEEWLVKLGAIELVRMSDNYVRYNLDGIQLSISPERDFFIEYVHQIPIKYLHTLQNFYFATKQTELEVK